MSKWNVYSPPPKNKLESQLKYRIINLNNQLKTNCREVLESRIYRRHNKTGRKGRDPKRADLSPIGS